MRFLDLPRTARQTPLREYYLAMDAILDISTNSESILAAARESFASLVSPQPAAQVTMRLWVDATAQASPIWPRPYFGGLNNVIFAGFDSKDSLLIDLRGRRAIGRFSPAMAADSAYWKRLVFPALIGIVGPSAGVTALHCACGVHNKRGLLLVGGSGSGKSTLSLALAMNGDLLLSDDWTYFSCRDGRLLAWGLPTPLKLLPDAVGHFPELVGQKPAFSLNDDLAFNVDPEKVFGVRRTSCCEPTWLFFLEREAETGFRITEIPPAEAAARLDGNLPPRCPEEIRLRQETIERLVQCRSWLLRYGGKPRAVAQALADFVQRLEGCTGPNLRCT